MKISPKHFPPISILCQKKFTLDFSMIEPSEEQLPVMRKLAYMLIVEGRKNIFTVSKSIQKMLSPNREKLTPVYWSDPEKKSFSGAYIETEMAAPSIELFNFIPGKEIHPNTGKEQDCLQYFFASVQGENVVVAIGNITLFYEGNSDFIVCPHIATVKGELHDQEITNCQNYMLYLMDVCIFLKYADVEVVQVYGNQRKSMPDKSDVIENKSGVPIKYIDSRWLREIIRTEGFKVRGHFRLQPMKDEDGEWTRKLIYINEFEKHGYHRRAFKNIVSEQNAN